MRVKFSWGMGARPHVSEAKLNPNEDAGAETFSIAGALVALHCPTPRLGKQTAFAQVLA